MQCNGTELAFQLFTDRDFKGSYFDPTLLPESVHPIHSGQSTYKLAHNKLHFQKDSPKKLQFLNLRANFF